jgi:hypothetical protein
MRPDDLVVLELELVGLVAANDDGQPIAVAAPGWGDDRLPVSHLPAQHITSS